MKVRYARVSSNGQNLQSQIELLKKAGCEKIFQKKSGRHTSQIKGSGDNNNSFSSLFS